MKEQPTISDLPLEEVDASTLRRIWSAVKGAAPPKTFTARLMRLGLAWKAQAATEGRECAANKRAWKRIIRARSGRGARTRAKDAIAPTANEGTRILKDWGGKTHEILVTEGGASWNGQSYSSLSAVARAMTGTNRNGPKFFGLREGAKK